MTSFERSLADFSLTASRLTGLPRIAKLFEQSASVIGAV